MKDKNEITLYKRGKLLNPEVEKNNCTYWIQPQIIESISVVIKLIELWPERENSSLHTNMHYL